MTKPRALRAVSPNDVPPPKAMTVAQAAERGTHRDLLVAMRARIAKTVADPDCPPRDLAALTRRLQDIAREIEQLDLRIEEEGGNVEHVEDEAWDAEAL